MNGRNRHNGARSADERRSDSTSQRTQAARHRGGHVGIVAVVRRLRAIIVGSFVSMVLSSCLKQLDFEKPISNGDLWSFYRIWGPGNHRNGSSKPHQNFRVLRPSSRSRGIPMCVDPNGIQMGGFGVHHISNHMPALQKEVQRPSTSCFPHIQHGRRILTETLKEKPTGFIFVWGRAAISMLLRTCRTEMPRTQEVGFAQISPNWSKMTGPKENHRAQTCRIE